MSYHFHSSIQVEEGEYGNAILSSYPALVKAGPPADAACPTKTSNDEAQSGLR